MLFYDTLKHIFPPLLKKEAMERENYLPFHLMWKATQANSCVLHQEGGGQFCMLFLYKKT